MSRAFRDLRDFCCVPGGVWQCQMLTPSMCTLLDREGQVKCKETLKKCRRGVHNASLLFVATLFLGVGVHSHAIATKR